MKNLLETIAIILLLTFVLFHCDPKSLGEGARAVKDGFCGNEQNSLPQK
jgi:hypothetical protein